MQQMQDEDQQQAGEAPNGAIKRLLLVTDTWNETNGVTTTLQHTLAIATARGYDISLLHPCMFSTFSNPFYRQYRLALPTP